MTHEKSQELHPIGSDNSLMIFLIGFVIGTILTSVLLMRLIKYFSFIERLKIQQKSSRPRRVSSVNIGGDEEKTA